MTKTGRAYYFLLSLLISTAISSPGLAEPTVEVSPSSTQIGLDENLSIEFKASIDDYKGEIGAPEFNAPDFDEVNIYAGMTGIESSIVNGSISVKRTRSVTVVLHPKRTGKLIINKIQMKINGKPIIAPDITIDVAAISDPNKRRGQGNYGYSPKSQFPSSGVKPRQGGGNFFVKTEPSKVRAYKGEQIILTYAIYSTVPILGIYAERYPTLSGFLKEDMDISILGGRLQYSRSVVGGKEYNRAPLAQYAIFPLKEGKLTIDPLVAKYTYRMQGHRQTQDDDNDPFGILSSFIGSMQTTTDSRGSDRVIIEVLPLPAAGQPKGFTGLVGDFDITVMADKYTVKTGEPINVKVTVQGRGHAGSLEHLNVAWPKDFEQYEDKSSTAFQKTGRSERIFDFILIPRVKGEFEIPAIDLSMFNTENEKYLTRSSQPLKIMVLAGNLTDVPGSIASSSLANSLANSLAGKKEEIKQDIRYIIGDVEAGHTFKQLHGMQLMQRFKIFLMLLLGASFVLLGFVFFKRSGFKVAFVSGLKKTDLSYKSYLEKTKTLQRIDRDPAEVLMRAEGIIGDILSSRYDVSIGSMTRGEVKEALKVKVANQIVIDLCESLLERCENLRFAPGQAKPNLARQVVEDLILFIERIKST